MTAARTIVITGATRGLGNALTQHFIAQGHTIVGCGRNAADITALLVQHGAQHRFDVVDVADNEQVGIWARNLLKSHGIPDLLLNCAALANIPAPLWTISAIDFNDIIDVNVKGTANVIRHIVPAMVDAGRGVIVNFSSGWGRSVDAGVAPYCASKWAIEGLTQALAHDLPKGMAAVPLDPGIIDTDMLRTTFGSAAGSYPPPEEWVTKAAPYILALGPKDNGKPLSVR